MRTVMYYVPGDTIYADYQVVIRGGYWVDPRDNKTRNYADSALMFTFLVGEKGVMTLKQEDLDHLVSRGLLVLGDVCEP